MLIRLKQHAPVSQRQSRDGLARAASMIWRSFFTGLAILSTVANTTAQMKVRTIGGGRLTATGKDFGFIDGNTLQSSQFHTPVGIAVDPSGILFVADRDNGSLRRVDVAANRSSTLVLGLNQPVAVAVPDVNEIYVLTRGDGSITKFDRFGTSTPVASGLSSPNALALDNQKNIYVAEEGGAIIRISGANGSTKIIASGFNRPAGIAVLDSGAIAVSDTGNNQVLFINAVDGHSLLQIGSGKAGFRDGLAASAQFNQPMQLASAPNGGVVVADLANNRVRQIDIFGTVSTIYGIDPTKWEGPECLTCSPVILPGWYDAGEEFAEAREPMGVAVTRAGKLYTTEVYYHIVREVTGAGFSGGSSGGPDLVVLPPIISPNSGFFPSGQIITVVNPNANVLLPTSVFYTTDGTSPTTNSLRVPLAGNSGTINWAHPTRDLTSLRLKAFVGTQASEEISGVPSSENVIGIPRNVVGGMGSTLAIPVVVNLRTNTPLKSLQFRVEVSPVTPGAAMVPPTFDALSIRTNDFIVLATSDRAAGTPATNYFNASPYELGSARGLVVSMIGTNSNLSVSSFSVVAMLSVPIPTTAKAGDLYQIEVLRPSATSDGIQASVPLAPMEPHFITVKNVSYEAGDSARSVWYNADIPGLGVGDGVLDNADVNNAFSASMGVRVPFRFSDLFDAMDAFPEDREDAVGGDGLIRFLDWQLILMRSLGLDSSRWMRTWSEGGIRTARRLEGGTANAKGSSPATVVTGTAPGSVWVRQATITATSLDGVDRGVPLDVPVTVTVAPGSSLAGLAFRIMVEPEGSAPEIVTPVQFIPAPEIANPLQSPGLSPSDLLCGWSLVPSPAFKPALQGTTLLGHLRVTLPTWASQGQFYHVRFLNADGSPNLKTQYDVETVSSRLGILTPASHSVSRLPDEWKIRFFGSTGAPEAQTNADSDGDGVSNIAEYLTGTDPTRSDSRLQLDGPAWSPQRNAPVLRWLSAPNKFYTIEYTINLLDGVWTELASDVPGDGFVQEFAIDQNNAGNQFYRLRVK
ncbi:MAG: hypothetical protein EXS31_17310 [Pedosphaera sp.]|nr:hypothetical protein [Pedosphaera sp.]